MKSPLLSNLEGLVGLAGRNGVDISHTLLRVLTDLYVQKPVHTEDEQQHYVELATRLLDRVGTPVRLAVATRLSKYAQAPLPILRKLARDELDIATPVLQHSAVLPQEELIAIAEEFGPHYAAVVAARPEFRPLIDLEAIAIETAPSPQPVAAPAEHIRSAHIDIAAPSIAPEIAADAVPSQAAGAGNENEADDDEARALSEMFFAAEAKERRLILVSIDYAPIAAAPASANPDVLKKLEQAALLRDMNGFARLLETNLALPPQQARRLVADASGETIVVAAKALGMPAEVLQRVLLFLNPAVGQSVQRVYDLSRLHDEITEQAALRMIALWQGESRARKLQHAPLHVPDGDSPRMTAQAPSRIGKVTKTAATG
jgi:hypothetical protein